MNSEMKHIFNLIVDAANKERSTSIYLWLFLVPQDCRVLNLLDN